MRRKRSSTAVSAAVVGARPSPHLRGQDASSLGRCRPRLYTRRVKIALGQINPTVGDFSGNAAKIIDFSRRAQSAGAGMILFPELSVCGYPPRDLAERPSFVLRHRDTRERVLADNRRTRAT